jgi:hypothetical protein
MKTPYQIAKELKVSPQAVYKRLTDEFINQVGYHIQRTEKGRYLLDEFAEQKLKNLFGQVQQPSLNQFDPLYKIEQSLLNQLHTENAFLRARVEGLEVELRTERAHSRGQTDKLSDLAAQLAELTRNNQILLGAEQSRTNPGLLAGGERVQDEAQDDRRESTQPVKKRGLWGLFKKSNKGES